ncbi:SMP-30/gluconolactonase/LRE family protein [Pseudonocardia ailaonensis]|uniref:SMP-30/gluconolactonase/LRE family protein n=1 Tax=Pseudonocardia ailaonensis TaxID=367279 RepID=A0ABN2N0U0_9PSEU
MADGFRLPESLRWHDGRLWMSDMDGGAVLVLGTRGPQRVLDLPAQPSGLGWDPRGRLLVVSQLDARLLRVDGDRATLVADLAPVMHAHGGDVRPNDMWVAPDGTAYIGSASFQVVEGRLVADDRVPTPLVAVSPAGAVTLLTDELLCPNGIAPCGPDAILVAETRSSRLVEVRPGSPTVVREHAPCVAGPDGIALDPAGGVWAAFPFAGRVQRIAHGGAVLDEIDLGPRIPLDCTLGGPTGDTLFVASVAEIDHLGSSRTGRVDAYDLTHRQTEEP